MARNRWMPEPSRSIRCIPDVRHTQVSPGEGCVCGKKTADDMAKAPAMVNGLTVLLEPLPTTSEGGT